MISVVVPFHNVKRYIADSIEGLLAQSYPSERLELIFVNNGSNDGSAEIVSRVENITVYDQPVPGSYAARNLGIRHSSGEIIATLDPDCRPDRDWLVEAVRSLENPKCSIVLGHVRHAHSSTLLDLLEKYEAEKVSYIMDRGEANLYFGYTNNMAFRRKLFDEIGLFPERIRGGDTIFVHRAVDKFGVDVMTFNPQMRATHLELDTVKAYYAKRRIYGGSNEHIARTMDFRPLKNGERWQVFKRLVKNHRFSFKKTVLLLALLAPGAVFYEAGRRKRMLELARKSD